MSSIETRPRIDIQIDEKLLSDIPLFIAYLEIYNVNVSTSCEKQIEELSKIIEEVKSKFHDLGSLLQDRVIRAYRDFYWKIKIDPTKQRPAAEALIRRVMRHGSIPLINNVVDAGNMASLATGIPIGLYDIDKIEGNMLLLKYSTPGDEFFPIGGKRVVLRGEPCLYDSKKILHLYPHRDSEYTKITDMTRNVLVVSCGVPNIKYSEVLKAAELTKRYILEFAGGTTTRIVFRGSVRK